MLTTRDTGESDRLRSDRERREARAIDEASGVGRKFEGSLRFAVREVDRQISRLAAQASEKPGSPAAIGGLISTWASLLDQLALGPPPDVRSCPECGRLGMSAATVCGYCWAPLSPPPQGQRASGEG